METTSKDDFYKLIKTMLIPLAKKEGLDFTFEEFKEFEKNYINNETMLSEDELAALSSGGKQVLVLCITIGAGGKCFCMFFGAGKKNSIRFKILFLHYIGCQC